MNGGDLLTALISMHLRTEIARYRGQRGMSPSQVFAGVYDSLVKDNDVVGGSRFSVSHVR